MNEALNILVGKTCCVEMSGKVNIVNVVEIKGNWLVVEDDGQKAFVNINRIDEIYEMVEKPSVRRTLLNNTGR
ncbi:MAG: hypothetical protein E7509_05830 [Ruminococcus sp.]|nr:hypothetical protein [Ruminococcus sp.]